MIAQLAEHVPAEVLSAGVCLWGFDGTNTANTKLIRSVDELKALVEAKTALAGYVYVYTWVPILPHAPWFPFAIIATNNKFDNVPSEDRKRPLHKGYRSFGRTASVLLFVYMLVSAPIVIASITVTTGAFVDNLFSLGDRGLFGPGSTIAVLFAVKRRGSEASIQTPC